MHIVSKRNIHRLSLVAILVVFVFTLLISFATEANALQLRENPTLRWIDRYHMGVRNNNATNEVVFVDVTPYPINAKADFSLRDACGTHTIVQATPGVWEITFRQAKPANNGSIPNDYSSMVDNEPLRDGWECAPEQKIQVLDQWVQNPENSTKDPTSTPPTGGGGDYASMTFAWVNASIIDMYGTGGRLVSSFKSVGADFINSADPNYPTCGDTITNVSSDKKSATLQPKTLNLSRVCINDQSRQPFSIAITNPENQQLAPTYEANDPSSAQNSGTTPEEGCSSSVGAFGWMLCPIIDIANGVFQFFINRIKSLLFIDSSFFENDASGKNGLKESWTAVRNVANTLVVLVALVVIASQIFGFKFLDAYTIKSLLPKLLIAVIFIQLSWYIFTLMIDLVNAIGLGIHSLLVYPFVSDGAGSANIADLYSTANQGNDGTAGWTSIIALASGGVAAGIGIGALATSITTGGWLAIVFAIIGAFISILVAMFVLLARQIVILILLTLAPLAIIAWVLPNTQNWWKAWWTLFSKLLLMFPLIMVLFAGGTIAANVIADTFVEGQDGFESGFGIVAMIVAYFAPLFLVIGTFKFAGGIFGKIVDVANKGGAKAKGFGYMGAKDRAKESYKEGKRAKGFENATSIQPGIKGKIRRTRGRIAAGTFGAGGVYKRQLRSKERETALGNANSQITEDLKEFGMTDYGDQVKYMEALASGKSEYTITKGQNAGTTVGIRQYGTQGRQAATEFLASKGKAEELRNVKQALDSEGVIGQRIWSDASAHTAGDIVKKAGDLVGKSFGDMTIDQATSQHASTVQIMGDKKMRDLQAIANPTARAGAIRAAQKELEDIQKSSSYLPNSDTASRDAFDDYKRQLDAELARVAPPPPPPPPPPGPVVINLTATPTGGAPAPLSPANVRVQINSAGGVAALDVNEVAKIWQHAQSQASWATDPDGSAIIAQSKKRLQDEGILPP